MTTLTVRDVENLKAAGRYFEAGSLAADLGSPCYYGCHYGMKSNLSFAIEKFRAGYIARAHERANAQAAANEGRAA